MRGVTSELRGFIGILLGGGHLPLSLRSLSTRLQDQILDLSGGAVIDLSFPCSGGLEGKACCSADRVPFL
jgi:hypothetical protein